MADPRVEGFADVLVNYSTRTKKGDVVQIDVIGDQAKPLVVEVYRQVIKKDPKEVLFFNYPEEVREALIREAPLRYLSHTPDLEYDLMKKVDVYFLIYGRQNTRFLSTVPLKRMSAFLKMRRPIVGWRVAHTRWVLTEYPTPALAQDADVSLAEFEDFVFGAVNIDWKAKSREQAELARIFNKGREVRIVGEDTDLTLKVQGRTFISADGHLNMPDGEVFSGPVEDSAEGHIRFTYPAIYQAREVHDVHLWFEKGKVVKETASKGLDYLKQMLNTDPGARYIGELGIGNNFGIDRFIKSILFDEKIGGSIHLALGSSYRETGGKNKSAVHWDMIKDLRQGGEIYLDGEVVQKNGKWLIGRKRRK